MRRNSGSSGVILLILLLLMSSAGLGIAYYMGFLDQFIQIEDDEAKAEAVVVEAETETEAEAAEAVEAAAPIVGEFPADISGLSGRYDVASFDETSRKWGDISGKGNDVTVRKGNIKKTDTYVYGSTGEGLKFPTEVLGEGGIYTMFWVARYNGAAKLRIFDGTDNNWLSGFHNGSTGVAHHDSWLTHQVDSFGDHAWIQGTDAPNKFRVFGDNLVKNASVYGTTPQITINMGEKSSGQSSDWAVKEVIFYNRMLSPAEIERVEKYLSVTYFQLLPEDIVVAKGYKTGGVDIDDPRDVPFGYGTQEDCRQQAKTLGYPVWAHRSKDHPENIHKNRCFYYPEGAFTEYADNEEDNIHTMGCVDPEKDIYAGCMDEEE
jgi:hypothetical protein